MEFTNGEQGRKCKFFQRIKETCMQPSGALESMKWSSVLFPGSCFCFWDAGRLVYNDVLEREVAIAWERDWSLAAVIIN